MARFSYKKLIKEMRKHHPSTSKRSIPKRVQRLEAKGDKESTHPRAHEIAIELLQQDAIPNNESRITNNDASASIEDGNILPKITLRNFLKHPIFLARFLGYAIPLCFLLYVLYINYLPFGYHKTFTIEVGSANDTKISEFYLEPSKGLSERMTADDGTAYRELNGVGKVVFKPKAVLNNAQLTVETSDPGISFIPPYVDFNPEDIDWDLHWDLTKEIPTDLINTNVFFFEHEPYFDGTSRLEMTSSSDMFEDGPFTVYVEWKPKDSENDFQQIVGHFNWEVLQNKNTVRFMIGRVDNVEGQFYTADYTIPHSENFFTRTHTLVAIYQPDPENGNGFIEIYVDGYFGSRTMIGKSIIWKDYNGRKNLTSGKSDHGAAAYLQANVYNIRIRNKVFLKAYKKIYLNFQSKNITKYSIPIVSMTTTTLDKITLHAEQE